MTEGRSIESTEMINILMPLDEELGDKALLTSLGHCSNAARLEAAGSVACRLKNKNQESIESHAF